MNCRTQHPLKSLLYAEWFLLAIAFFHQWWWPADALSILLNRKLSIENPQGDIRIAIGSEQTAAIVIILCSIWILLLWKLPKINKWYLGGLLLNLLINITVFSIGTIFPDRVPQLALILFFGGFSLFTLLGSLRLPTTTIDKWLYTRSVE
jgi:hypothetical protein